MKYMLLVYLSEDALTENERLQCYKDSAKLSRDLHESGNYLAASPLQPIATATSLRVRNGKRLITDGPFAETHEQLGGFRHGHDERCLGWRDRRKGCRNPGHHG